MDYTVPCACWLLRRGSAAPRPQPSARAVLRAATSNHLTRVPASALATWSTAEVALVRGRSRLICSKSLQPLKQLNPGAPGGACHVVLAT